MCMEGVCISIYRESANVDLVRESAKKAAKKERWRIANKKKKRSTERRHDAEALQSR